MSQNRNEAFEKNARFESLESRIVLSANALTNFATIDIDHSGTEQIQTTSVSLNQVHQQTGVHHIHQNYGFQGDGQTVVVIDSGIAWDHYALGGGFGEGYRVVGGWDFAHNDADPFDGGSAGFHGTHVAGIIGSSDTNNRGVAAGVDLVALRVFDDNGSGSLEHVRQALAWVNNNLSTFANPITTVNLSLGTNWNSNQIPFWANLEAEFAQLKANGVFISVAAGNSFQSYQSVGVSYPAASPYVVPVSSHGSSGQMSSFSQRNDRVLVAPGESIRSTVPGHLFGQAVSSQFLAASGTSMAAPYVAGSSVLLREAMQFMGYNDVNQDAIYNHLQQTADMVFDSVTGLSYHHINLRAAMESIVLDLHGDTLETATHIGTLDGGEQLTGTIGTFDDVDAIRFTAARSGTMTFTFQQTHDLSLHAQLHNHNVSMNGNTLTFDVVAGQDYTLLLSTNAGIGHYTIDSSIELQNIQAADLGTVFGKTVNLQNSGQQWYQVTAGRNGIVAFQLAGQAGQNVSMQVFNAQQQLLGTATTQGNSLVIQTQAQAGQTLFLSIDGNFSANLQLQNLVSLQNGVLTVNGTNQSNQVAVRDGAQVAVTVDGVEYTFNRSQLQRVQVYAHGGQNQLNVVQDHVGHQTAHIHQNHIYVFGSNYVLLGHSVQNIQYHGHIQDTVRLFDTLGNDTFIARAGHSEMLGTGYHNQAFGVARVVGIASSGNDQAMMYGTTGNDLVYSNPTYTVLTAGQHWALARGFNSVTVDGNGGVDIVAAFGSHDNETLSVQPNESRFQSTSLSREFLNFRNQQFFGVGGQNQATLQGGTAGNTFDAYWNRAHFNSGQQATFLSGFQSVTALGNPGDQAILFDSLGNDTFDGDAGWGRMQGTGYSNQAVGFGLTIARFSGGQDTSNLYNIQSGVHTTQLSDRTTATYSSNFQVRSVGLASVNLAAHQLGQQSLGLQSLTGDQSWGLGQRSSDVDLHVSVFAGAGSFGLVNRGLGLDGNSRVWSSFQNTSMPQGTVTGATNFAPALDSEKETGMTRSVQAAFEHLGADDMAVIHLRPTAVRATDQPQFGLGGNAAESLAAADQSFLDQLVDDFFATLR